MLFAEGFNRVVKGNFQGFDRFPRIAALIIKVCATDGMKHCRVDLLFTLRQNLAEQGEIVVKLSKILPNPRVDLGIMRRIIALSLPVLRIGKQVLTHQIDARNVLTFRKLFQLLRGNVPTAAAVRFRNDLLFTKLRRNGRNLLRRKLVINVTSKPINSRDMLKLIERHNPRAAPHLTVQTALLNVVSRQLVVPFIAPSINLFRKVFQHQILQGFPKLITECAIAFLFHEEQTKPVENILAVGILKVFRQHSRIGGIPTVVLRLVREEAL